MKIYTIPDQVSEICKLPAGTQILLSGCIYTARDAAHTRMFEALKSGKRIPLSLSDSVIYYCGPTPAKKGEVIGSCGPTTSRRMDAFTPYLISKGLRLMIGKGDRSEEVVSAIKKYKAVYCVTYGGCGAYLQKKVKRCSCIAYPELGPEAIYQIMVDDFPVMVGIDATGKNFM